MNKKETVIKDTKKEIAIAPRKELVMEGDPQAQLEFAQKAAKALMSVVATKKNPVMINGKQFLEFGDMQTLGRFFGATVAVEWTKKVDKGWEARAIVYQRGETISAAEAQCTKDESKWKNRDDFQIRSMAQTRASSKALKNAFGWVAELAGYSSTPAEEMVEEVQYDRTPIKASAKVVSTGDDDGTTTDPVLQRKNFIKKFVLARTDAPFLEGYEFVDYVKENTGLDLKDTSIKNLDAIIERLKTIWKLKQQYK